MLGSNGTFDTGLRTMVRGVSRWGTLCGVLGIVVLFSGCVVQPTCTADADCDDGAFCNGAETCGDDGRCADGTAPCDEAAGETCNETDDRCDVCDADADCDDGDACTDDSCAAGQCVNTAADCDDGIACTDDSCDAATGACVNESNCAEGEVCNETTGACDTVCTTDDDCAACEVCTDGACAAVVCEDDGDNCTTEACDPATGVCESTPVECPAGQVCVDGLCVEQPCTADADCADDGLFCNGTESCDTNAGVCVSSGDPCADVAGTCDEDTDSCVNPGTGFDLTTDDDAITGTTGDDTFTAGVGTLNPGDIVTGNGGNDVMNATVAGATSSQATLIDIDNVNFNTLNGVTFDAVNTAAVGAFNVASGSTGNLTLTNVESGTNFGMGSGYAKIMSVTAATAGDATLTLSGTAEGAVFDYTNIGGNDLTIDVTADSVISPGNAGTDFFGGAGTTEVTGSASLTLFGGDATDMGADGIDTSGFTGMLIVAPAADAALTIDFSSGGVDIEGVDQYTIMDTMTFAHSVTVENTNHNFIIDVSEIDADDSAGAVTFAHVSAAANNDSLTVNLGGAGDGIGALTASDTEFITINSGGTTANAIANVTGESGTSFVTESVSCTGDQDLDLGTVTTEVVDCTALSGGLTMTCAVTMQVDSGAGDDDITGSAAADLINTGDGDDKLTGGTSADSLTGGAGSDTYQYTATTDGGAADADNVGMDLIFGFTVGADGDILGFQDNIFFTDAHTLDLDIITGAANGGTVTGLTDGGATSAQVIVQTTVLTDFAAVAALFTAIDGVITTADAIVIAEVSGVGTFVFWDGATGTANGEQVLAELDGITAADLADMVAANLAINDG